MITRGQATLLGENVRSFVGLSFVGLSFVASFSLAMALLIWQTAFDENPVANAMAKALYDRNIQYSQEI